MTSPPPPQLITMPHSHYVEKARWALDWLGRPYVERPHVPLLHRLFTTRHGGGSVPVWVDGATCLSDSTDILRHLDAAAGGGRRLFPQEPAWRQEVEALEARFDGELGPHARRWAYFHLLPHRSALRRIMSRGVPAWEALLLRLLMPVVARVIRAAFRITPESAERSRQRVEAVFHEVGERLGDGREFLVGDRFSAADLTFAALASPVLLPPQCGASYPPLEAVPPAMRDEVLRLRATPAGRFAMRVYAQQRQRSR